MYRLIDSILGEDYVNATRFFEEAMEEIKEQKFYEVKRSLDLVEAEGKGEFKGQYYNDKEDWARYRKAHPSLGYHDTPTGKVRPKRRIHKAGDALALTKYGIAQRKKQGYGQAFPMLFTKKFVGAVADHLEKEAMKSLNTPVKRGRKKKQVDEAKAMGNIPGGVAQATQADLARAAKFAEILKRAQQGTKTTGQFGTQKINIPNEVPLGSPSYTGSPESKKIKAQQQRPSRASQRIRNLVTNTLSGKKSASGVATGVSRATKLLPRTAVGKALSTAGKVGMFGLRWLDASMSENISFTKPRRRRVVKRKPLQHIHVKKVKLKKNKYRTEVPEPESHL